jgi:hypothetical protein
MGTKFEDEYMAGGAWSQLAGEHGEAVTYKVAGAGNGSSVTGIWHDQGVEEITDSANGIKLRRVAAFEIPHDATFGIADPAIDDTITRGGNTFRVRKALPQNNGVSVLDLEEVTVTERSTNLRGQA